MGLQASPDGLREHFEAKVMFMGLAVDRCESLLRMSLIRTVRPNKRLKLPGGDRSSGSGVLCSWRSTNYRPTLDAPAGESPAA